VKLSFAPGLFWILLLCLFLSDFNLNPVFVINCTHDNNGFQSSMSPSGETLSLGLSCQNLTQPDFPTRAPVEFGFSVSPKAHVLKAWSPGDTVGKLWKFKFKMWGPLGGLFVLGSMP
jgi:hypothetical protein